MTKFLKPLTLIVVMSISAAVLGGRSWASMPAVGTEASADLRGNHKQGTVEGKRARSVDRVLAILQSRIGGRRIPDSARERLASMDGRDFRLVAILCERIAATGDQAGTDLALLLAAALIALS